jgi:hypothetical protein
MGICNTDTLLFGKAEVAVLVNGAARFRGRHFAPVSFVNRVRTVRRKHSCGPLACGRIRHGRQRVP